MSSFSSVFLSLVLAQVFLQRGIFTPPVHIAALHQTISETQGLFYYLQYRYEADGASLIPTTL